MARLQDPSRHLASTRELVGIPPISSFSGFFGFLEDRGAPAAGVTADAIGTGGAAAADEAAAAAAAIRRQQVA